MVPHERHCLQVSAQLGRRTVRLSSSAGDSKKTSENRSSSGRIWQKEIFRIEERSTRRRPSTRPTIEKTFEETNKVFKSSFDSVLTTFRRPPRRAAQERCSYLQRLFFSFLSFLLAFRSPVVRSYFSYCPPRPPASFNDVVGSQRTRERLTVYFGSCSFGF